MGVHETRSKMVLRIAKMEKSTILAHRNHLRHLDCGLRRRSKRKDAEVFAKARVIKAKDCKMKIYFKKGMAFSGGT